MCCIAWQAAAVKDVMLSVSQALAELHEVGIVVRDVKPGNVLYDRLRQYVLADFGISSIIKTSLTRNGIPASTKGTKGTFSYMAPEAFDPEFELTPEVDVWGVGCIGVECLGKAPFQGTPDPHIMRKVVIDKATPLIPLDTPPALAKIIRQCFEHEPADRPTAAQLCEMLSSMNMKTVATISASRMEGFVAHQASIKSLLSSESKDSVHRGVQEGWKLIDSILAELYSSMPAKQKGGKKPSGMGSYVGALKKMQALPEPVCEKISSKIGPIRNMESHQGGMLLDANWGFINLEIVDELLEVIAPEERADEEGIPEADEG